MFGRRNGIVCERMCRTTYIYRAYIVYMLPRQTRENRERKGKRKPEKRRGGADVDVILCGADVAAWL